MSGLPETIPVIDLGPYLAGEPGAMERTAGELRFALTEIGFYFIVNHGVPDAQIRETFRQAARFHALPLDRKMEIRIDRHNVGYLPMRGDTLRTSTVQTVTKANLNEALFVARDLPADHPDVQADRRFRSANRWPATCRASATPSSPTATRWSGWCRNWCASMPSRSICHRPISTGRSGIPVQVAGDPLPEPAGRRRRRVRHRPAHRHQFPHPARAQRGARPLDPHAKRQVDRRAGPSGRLCREWRAVAAALDQRFFLATPHRAVNRSGGERYALAFFCDSHIDWPIAAVPTCVGPDKPPKYPTTYYTDYMVQYQKRTYDLLADDNRQAAE